MYFPRRSSFLEVTPHDGELEQRGSGSRVADGRPHCFLRVHTLLDIDVFHLIRVANLLGCWFGVISGMVDAVVLFSDSTFCDVAWSTSSRCCPRTRVRTEEMTNDRFHPEKEV